MYAVCAYSYYMLAVPLVIILTFDQYIDGHKDNNFSSPNRESECASVHGASDDAKCRLPTNNHRNNRFEG